MQSQRAHVFLDRREAGRMLGDALKQSNLQAGIVLGLARGGVIVAVGVAERLECELDVLVARKLGAPWSAELAIGAVTANSGLYLNRELIKEIGISDEYVAGEVARQREQALLREERYRRERSAPHLGGRSVVLVDDGLATGATMIAAARHARAEGAARVTVAVPVGVPESCEALQPEADEVVCLFQPRPFLAVGWFYHDFSEVPDGEVEEVLTGSRSAAQKRVRR